MTHNTRVKLDLLFGWGIAIYAVMYLLASGLFLYGLSGSMIGRVAMLAALLVIATVAGRSLKLSKWEDILPYSLAWLGITILFDVFFAAHAQGFEIFLDPGIWFGYSLVIFVPLLAPHTRA